MIAAAVILYATAAVCAIVAVGGMSRSFAEMKGWVTPDTGGHAEAFFGGIILLSISSGLCALASLAWGAAS